MTVLRMRRSWTRSVLLLTSAIILKFASPRDCPINPSLLWQKHPPVVSPEAFAKIEPLLKYDFYLPELHLRDGVSYYGSAIRLRKFASDLIAGTRPLKIGVVGGSISAGQGSSRFGVTDWFTVFADWLTSVTKANVTRYNGSKAATRSSFHVTCLSMDPDVDLLFLEFNVNDGMEDRLAHNFIIKNSEQLLQRVLALPGRPAVVFMQVPLLDHDPKSEATTSKPFYHTSEDVEGALTGYYGVQSLSFRNAVYKLNLDPATTDGFRWSQLFADFHPGDAGHKVIADLAVHLIQTAAFELMYYPITEGEKQQLNVPLPRPMYDGNLPPERPACAVGLDFVPLVHSTEGFQWVNEGEDWKPKWGYVATVPGSSLVIRVDVRVYEVFSFYITYLQSYASVGVARFECQAGCECHPGLLDAFLPVRNSQMAFFIMGGIKRAIGAQDCDIRVTVLNETSTGGHKIKISGVVIINQASV